MYATRSKKVKTDKRDARTLCEQRDVPAHLAVRETPVRTRRVHLTGRRSGTARGLPHQERRLPQLRRPRRGGRAPGARPGPSRAATHHARITQRADQEGR
jgi:hypothetical protein